MKSDSEVLQNVLSELKWDHRIGETEVGVEVDKGVVTLTGTVSSYGKKFAASEAAHRVKGVLDVANDINVIPPESTIITDTDIATAVRNTLKWDTFLPDEKIKSTVSNGWVTLEGTLATVGQRQEVEAAIRYLAGVRGVINSLKVEKKTVNPIAVKSTIEDALERRAEREARDIRVLVNDSSVTLAGRVHSWEEKKAVVAAAGHIAGIQRIVDNLHIDPSF
jgi:osmotically-inducible protein OsmY